MSYSISHQKDHRAPTAITPTDETDETDVVINILEADIKVNYIGKVNNTEAAEGMVEISSTFDHMFSVPFQCS